MRSRELVVRGIHRHLSEEIDDLGMLGGDGGDAVPKVVQREQGLCASLGALVVGSHEAAAQFHHVRKIILYEAFAEMEHMGCGKDGLAFGVQTHVRSHDVAVTSENSLGIGIPDDNLLVWVLHGIELVDIGGKAAAASCLTEGFFAKTADFLHYVGGVVSVNNVYDVPALVRIAEFLIRGEFRFQKLYRYRVDNLFHITRDCIPFPLPMRPIPRESLMNRM